MQNQYPKWKYVLLFVLIILGLVYAAPNFYGNDPAIQISGQTGYAIDDALSDKIKLALSGKNIAYKAIEKQDENHLLIRFSDTDTQIHAQDIIHTALGEHYVVALNLAPKTPEWLRALGANPLKLGLDLQGGVHFLLHVDVDSVVKARLDGDTHNIGQDLRGAKIRYVGLHREKMSGLSVRFKNKDALDDAYDLLNPKYSSYKWESDASALQLTATLTPPAINKINNYAIDQTLTVLTKRVNALGVSEAVVQRQGRDHISVDLPGVQDTARAKNIIGKTATVRFQMVDVEHSVQDAVSGTVPLGSRLYHTDEGRPVLLKNQVILKGSAITFATSSMSNDGSPAVSVRLGGGGESLFHRTTAASVGKPMAVVYVETKVKRKMVNGKPVTVHQKEEKVISVATIIQGLGNQFEINHLDSMQYAQNLALLLRSGALEAPVEFAQEQTIGPSLGKENIDKGLLSLAVGSLLVVLFMIAYYRVFGLIANLALVLNVVFLLALLSIVGATLTLSGIAGVVLTLGMAVDANVLIYERIREELRNGMTPQASIQSGYQRAFATIVDSNVTTLIVAVILFSLGSGTVQGFAVTLTIGLLASMVTAIFFTRAIVNWLYGAKPIKHLPIGIRIK